MGTGRLPAPGRAKGRARLRYEGRRRARARARARALLGGPGPARGAPEGDDAAEGERSVGRSASDADSSGDDSDVPCSAPAWRPDGRLADLRADVSAAREAFGGEAVEISDMGDSCRLLLRVDALAGGAIDRITAGAWGIDPGEPITVRMVVNAEEHASGALPALRVYQGHSPEESSLEPEKQLAKILSDFLRERVERPSKRLRLAGGTAENDAASTGTCSPHGFAAEHDLVSSFQEAEALRQRKAQALEAALDGKGGLVTQLLRYALRRLPTLHEYCAICDEPHTQPPMLQRTVCGRDFCCWQFAQFGRLISDAEGLNTTTEVTDLLVCLAIEAAKSTRRELVFDPLPSLFLKDAAKPMPWPDDGPQRMRALESLMRDVEAARNGAPASLGASWVADAELLQRHGELVRPMLQWLVRSTRCLLVPLRPEQRIVELCTELQYLLVSAAPEREARFRELRREHGSAFAFHGSAAENWHSILRNGLRNASHTPLMTSGASHGSGIYLSPRSNISAAYSRPGGPRQGATGADFVPSVHGRPGELTGNRKLALESLHLLAVCEVARHESLTTHRAGGDIWVAPLEETVVTRFLLVYSHRPPPALDLGGAALQARLRACVESLCVGGAQEQAAPAEG